MTETFVVAGCIAKNRAWVLPRWYAALCAQSRMPDSVFVLLNDCTDCEPGDFTLGAELNSEALLVSPLNVETFDTGDPGHDRISPRYSTANLARLRNEWSRRCLERWPQLTHLFSVDSDVIVDPDVLEKLLAADKAVVAAVVRNSTAEVWNFMLGGIRNWREGGVGDHGIDWSPHRTGDEEERLLRTEPFPVALTGACCLYRRDFLDAGFRWRDHPQGEDAGLCVDAINGGALLYVHPLARTSHVQRSGEIWR